MSLDVKARLKYGVVKYDRPYYYVREKNADERPHQEGSFGGEMDGVEVLVRDGRKHGLTLDENSFELVSHDTSLTTEDFYNSKEVTATYYEEIKELLVKELGASLVQIFHYQVRNEVKNNGDFGNINTSIQGYAHGIHSDTSSFSAEDLFKQMLSSTPEPEKYSKGRFMYINVWRSIADTPVENNHLAMCDEKSVVKPDDYMTTELHGEGYDILQYRMNSANSHLHKWYYFPSMIKNEAIIFKQWDSDTTRPSRLCFHTAFVDPDAPSNAVTRQSIEVRAIVYFPDHTPNTCPVTRDTFNEITGDKTIDKSVQKMIDLVGSMYGWPNAALVWIKVELVKGKKGIKTVATTLVDDEHGFLGLKHLPKETKEAIVTALLTKTDFEKVLLESFKKVQHRASIKNINVGIYTTVAVSVLCLAAGWGLCRSFNKS